MAENSDYVAQMTAAVQQFLQNFQAGAQASAANQSAQVAGLSTMPSVSPFPPEVTALQQEWLSHHARLWRTFYEIARSEGSKQADQQPTVAPISLEPVADRRFAHPVWEESPVYDYLRRAYLLNADYLRRMAEHVPVAEDKERQRLRYVVGQYVEALAPSNFAATNPEVIRTAVETGGESIRLGIQNLLGDLDKGRISMTDESAFEVGHNLAVTPGAVVFENEVFQLIQYSPLTEKVAQRPLLIVPPCINKYYVLDMQPKNSFVRYAVEQGNTVFLISWRNAKAEQGHLTWDDYVEDGVLKAISVVQDICSIKQINILGFCVGGTLLGSSLAVARGRGDNPVKSLTLLTTFLDFSDTGEIGMFVDEAMVSAKEKSIGKGGVYPGKELASVFSSLRPNDLIWQYVVGNYLKGNTPMAFDLLYWNTDPTNLPGPFFAWYLRNTYLENNIKVPGKTTMCGVSVDLGKVDMPAFILAAREDHIVPWRSAYDSGQLLSGEKTFVLGASGHIAGVVNPAAAKKRSYWVGGSDASDADGWLASATEKPGSWWTEWSQWLSGFGGRKMAGRGRLGNDTYPPLEPGPGRYVKERA
ncbi:MAG TPA: class I poly(R)-hydroxyalkanoic acid synthase [Rhodocyclaceae bacterium]|nr:class I poly(R)-hydroxyalkanoic acid synthase [Rhodocyclaceae bacterium]